MSEKKTSRQQIIEAAEARRFEQIRLVREAVSADEEYRRRQEDLAAADVARRAAINTALDAGMKGVEVAKLTGLTPARISQIRAGVR